RAVASIRCAATCEYVLANSNQNSSEGALMANRLARSVRLNELDHPAVRIAHQRIGQLQVRHFGRLTHDRDPGLRQALDDRLDIRHVNDRAAEAVADLV